MRSRTKITCPPLTGSRSLSRTRGFSAKDAGEQYAIIAEGTAWTGAPGAVSVGLIRYGGDEWRDREGLVCLVSGAHDKMLSDERMLINVTWQLLGVTASQRILLKLGPTPSQTEYGVRFRYLLTRPLPT